MLAPAVRVRPFYHQLPGRPARLLDHDEPLDGGPAASSSRRNARRTRRTAAEDGAVRQARRWSVAGEARRSRRPERTERRRPRSAARAAPSEHAAAAPAHEEEALRAAPLGGAAMSEDRTRVDVVRDLLERSSRPSACDGARSRSNEDDGDRHGTLHGEDLGLFIGRHGQTIDAVQHLAQRIVLRPRRWSERRRVVVDAEGYRARRARGAASARPTTPPTRRSSTDRPVALDAMTASERTLVHEYLRDAAASRRTARARSPTATSSSRPLAPSCSDVSRVTHVGAVVHVNAPRRARRAADRRARRPAPTAQRLARCWSCSRPSPTSTTTVRDPQPAVDVHVADSLVALELPTLRAAPTHRRPRRRRRHSRAWCSPSRCPARRSTLVESVGRKCAFIAAQRRRPGSTERRASSTPARRTGRRDRRSSDVVTARALAPLAVLVEYAAPLLRPAACWSPGRAAATPRRSRRRARPRRPLGIESARRVPGRAASRAPTSATSTSTSRSARPPHASRAGREWPANGRLQPDAELRDAAAPDRLAPAPTAVRR